MGAGNRSASRQIYTWIADNYYEWIKANIRLIPQYGRWDDLLALYNTPCEKDALILWSEAILSENPSVYGLACKWADRQDHKLRSYMNLSPKEFRKLLVNKTKVVETLMCEKKWDGINYNTVPSVASARYANAFRKHDMARYNGWRESLAKPESGAKVNAETLFPHDVIRMIRSANHIDKGLNDLAEAQFKAMPNYMEGTNYRIMPIVDFSGSMTSVATGSCTAFDVALSLGLYCSNAVGSKNPFWRKLIPFSETSKLESWNNMSLVKAISDIPNGYCGNTNIKQALKVLLDAGRFFNASNEQMPNVLLIISDMQFDQGTTSSQTPIEESLKEWKACGFEVPKIVYWNLTGYVSQPATAFHKNIGLVSGFSPSVLKAVLGGKDFSPLSIMNETISSYNIIDPRG